MRPPGHWLWLLSDHVFSGEVWITKCLQFSWMEVVKKTEQAILHLLYIWDIGEEGMLDGRICLALARIAFTTRTHLRPGFISESPGIRETMWCTIQSDITTISS